MNKTLKNKLIVEAIHGWYVIDRILFNATPDSYLNESTLNQYNLLKKKYLITLVEFYNTIGYKSRFLSIPKTDSEINYNSYLVVEDLRKDFDKEFQKNSKNYCKYIVEGIDQNNEKLVKMRTSYFCKSMMIENCFVNKPLQSCLNNIDKYQLKIYKNCLNEVKNELINLSKKYYTLFV